MFVSVTHTLTRTHKERGGYLRVFFRIFSAFFLVLFVCVCVCVCVATRSADAASRRSQSAGGIDRIWRAQPFCLYVRSLSLSLFFFLFFFFFIIFFFVLDANGATPRVGCQFPTDVGGRRVGPQASSCLPQRRKKRNGSR